MTCRAFFLVKLPVGTVFMFIQDIRTLSIPAKIPPVIISRITVIMADVESRRT